MEGSVKIWVVLGSIVLMLSASLPAAAQHGQGGRRLGQSGAGRPAQQVPARDAGAKNREAPRDGRMTPEERKQLRRDVNDHGRDIYGGRAGANRP
jgi:hypothetical protein